MKLKKSPHSWRHAGAALALSLTLATPALAAPATAKPAPAGAVRWNLADLYPTAAAWSASLDKTSRAVPALANLKTRLTESPAGMLATLAAISDLQREAQRLELYAALQGDEDLRNAPAQERRQQTERLFAQLGEATAWVAPTVVAMGTEQVTQFINAEPALKARFDQYLGNLLRGAAHTLSPEGEALLAAAGPLLNQPSTVRQQLDEAELQHGSTTLSTGQRVTLTPAEFERTRTSAIRADRKRVFDAFFGAYKKLEGSFGANLTAQVLGDVFSAHARHHPDSLSAALFADNMPLAVYRTLVQQAHEGLPTLHRYLRLRQRMLGISGPLAYYDNYPPLVPQPSSQQWSLERSKATTLAALAPLGATYTGLLSRVLDSPWVDSHPRPGKASGGYMGSAYDVHPDLLLNHSDNFESLSILAHEAGHAVHTLLAAANQPFEKFADSLFIAESASIANEMLLSDHMVATAATSQERLFCLSQALESIRTTFFRQVMFAEFQLKMHEEVEQGRPLSGARLSSLYCGLVKQYYGEAEGVMNVDPAYCVEWAYIGHFYMSYYVWQYATSMVGAAEFTSAIQSEGAPASERFLAMLKAGGSDYPYPLYLKAGIDMAQPAPYQALMARMNRLMDQFEAESAATAASPGIKKKPAAPSRQASP